MKIQFDMTKPKWPDGFMSLIYAPSLALAFGLACLIGYISTGGAGWLVFACLMGASIALFAVSMICMLKDWRFPAFLLFSLSFDLTVTGFLCGIDCWLIMMLAELKAGAAGFAFAALSCIWTVLAIAGTVASSCRKLREILSEQRTMKGEGDIKDGQL
jgi:hypothetical protein